MHGSNEDLEYNVVCTHSGAIWLYILNVINPSKCSKVCLVAIQNEGLVETKTMVCFKIYFGLF